MFGLALWLPPRRRFDIHFTSLNARNTPLEAKRVTQLKILYLDVAAVILRAKFSTSSRPMTLLTNPSSTSQVFVAPF